MPAPYTVKQNPIGYCDIYEDGEQRVLLTVWSLPGAEKHAAAIADRVARWLNESEYPIGEPELVAVRPSPLSP